MKNDDKYYAMLYDVVRTDSGTMSFIPRKIVEGRYDVEHDVFFEEGTNNMQDALLNVSDAMPNIGVNEEHVLDAVTDEIEQNDYDDSDGYFAFPIQTDYLKRLIDNGTDMKVEYERNLRCFVLSSIYDEEDDENVLNLTDKYSRESYVDVDTSKDFYSSVQTVILSESISNVLNEALELYNSGEVEDVSAEEFLQECLQDFFEEIGMGNVEVVFASANANKNGSPLPTKETSTFKPIVNDFDPDELEEKVTGEVIGQDHVAHALVTTIYKNKRYQNIDGLKSNMLILGPSGCGKTELVRSISRHLNIPMVIFDATSTSATGYVGNNITQALKDLIEVCGNDIEMAQNGIVVIDEIDKLADTTGSVGKGDVQDELFKMLEGDEITIAGENYREKNVRFNPKNVTFIGIGSAQELIEEKKKEKNKHSIGFAKLDDTPPVEEEEIILEPKDLIKFGLKPELLRRLGIIKVVKSLNEDKLKDILQHSNISNLKLYRQAFEDVDNVKLVCDDQFYSEVARVAIKENAGASGLKRVVDNTLEVALRKLKVLKGEAGELHISEKTVSNPEDFKLYRGTGEDKELVYELEPSKQKVLTYKGVIN